MSSIWLVSDWSGALGTVTAIGARTRFSVPIDAVFTPGTETQNEHAMSSTTWKLSTTGGFFRYACLFFWNRPGCASRGVLVMRSHRWAVMGGNGDGWHEKLLSGCVGRTWAVGGFMFGGSSSLITVSVFCSSAVVLGWLGATEVQADSSQILHTQITILLQYNYIYIYIYSRGVMVHKIHGSVRYGGNWLRRNVGNISVLNHEGEPMDIT